MLAAAAIHVLSRGISSLFYLPLTYPLLITLVNFVSLYVGIVEWSKKISVNQIRRFPGNKTLLNIL
jgi:hypothetical protein